MFNIFPVEDRFGEPIGYGMVGRDISDRRRMELSLREAKDSAEKANWAKSAFLANMSHEIRSPLGAIMGFSELIKTVDPAGEEFARLIAVINRNSQHLLRIVDDILDLSKVEAGQMLIENIPFSLGDLLAEFSALMDYRARDKAIDFVLNLETSIPAEVVSDPTRLRQILTNVVGNAIKFTDRGAVRCGVAYADGVLTITVRDTGPGIAGDEAARLFRPFQQADVSTTRRYGGTGLGLVLTRRLAEAMGGECRLVDSRVGVGSTFATTVRVVVQPATPMIDRIDLKLIPSQGKIATSHQRLLGRRILIIEDSVDNQELFTMMLGQLGANIEIAGDGVEGVAAARARDFDLVLCDVQMPRMDGYEATRVLRSIGFDKPIVALTAHAMREERDRALASGFTDFLTKPVRRDALVGVVQRWLGAAIT